MQRNVTVRGAQIGEDQGLMPKLDLAYLSCNFNLTEGTNVSFKVGCSCAATHVWPSCVGLTTGAWHAE